MIGVVLGSGLWRLTSSAGVDRLRARFDAAFGVGSLVSLGGEAS